jgi:hypothetical protein
MSATAEVRDENPSDQAVTGDLGGLSKDVDSRKSGLGEASGVPAGSNWRWILTPNDKMATPP